MISLCLTGLLACTLSSVINLSASFPMQTHERSIIVSSRARKKSAVAIGCNSRTPRNCTQLHSFLRVLAIGNHPESQDLMRVLRVLQGRRSISARASVNNPEEELSGIRHRRR